MTYFQEVAKEVAVAATRGITQHSGTVLLNKAMAVIIADFAKTVARGIAGEK